MKHTHILLLISFFIAVWTSAANYCGETVVSTNGNHTAAVTCSSLGNNMYQFIFESADDFMGYNAAGSNFYMEVNGVGGYHVSEHLKQEGNRLTAVVESSVVPKIYVGAFYVQYADGEAMYDIPTDADFSQDCTSAGDDNPPVVNPNQNLALHKPAVAGYGDNPNATNDDNLFTRWGTSGAPKDYSCDWWYVDLGAYYQLTEIDIFWEGAYSMNFVLQGAKDLPADVTDDVAWRTLYTFVGDPNVGNTESDVNVYPVSGAARYVRIKSYANSLQNQWGMSIWEFRVYGSELVEEDTTLPVVTTATLLGIDESEGSVTLELVAEKNNEPIYEFLVTDSRNNFQQNVIMSADNNTIRLTGFVPCRDYTLEVMAIDDNYNRSEPVAINTFTAPTGNLAHDRDCLAGFVENEGVVAAKAVDGDVNSRWSGYGAPEGLCWWQVDLGQIYDVEKVCIRFENSLIHDYTIAVSIDGDAWLPVWEMHEAPVVGSIMEYILQERARFVRISSVQNAMSFYEFEVYGTCAEILQEGHCVFQGGPGDGLTDEDARHAFTDGYRLEIWLNEEKDKVIIQSEVFDSDDLAAMIVLHRYAGSEVKQSKEVFRLYDYEQEKDLHNIQIEIPLQKFLTNFEEHGIKHPCSICITVKFELKVGGMRCTSLDYFMLDGSCAERSFIIYHHDDMPLEPERGALTQFEGGVIMRPIQYKRIFKPGIWETLCLPFEVTKVTVYDADDDAEYDLYAQYTDNAGTTQEGHFWLRTFDAKAAEVVADDFQSNWQDIRVTTAAEALPKKGIPYIMMMPPGDYYTDKYVIFHGKGSQEIDESYTGASLPPADYFSYIGNNTMMPSNLQSAYVIDAEGRYFESAETVVLQPFECAVNATLLTVRRFPRLGLNAQNDMLTGQMLPTTSFAGEVYDIMGRLMGQFESLDAYEALLHRLSGGFYIVKTEVSADKIYWEGRL